MSAAGATPLEEELRREAAGAVRAHAVANLIFAAFYAWIGFSVAPSRHAWFAPALGAVVLLLAVAGLTLLTRVRHARRVAQIAQTTLLAFAAVVLVLLVASAAYLRSIYGPLGQGMAAITLVVAALVVELCALLPILQLRALARPAVRRLLEGEPADSRSRDVAAAGGGG